jgi:hypothetical protein
MEHTGFLYSGALLKAVRDRVAAAACPGLEALQVYLSFSLAIQASASASVANALAAVVGRVPVTAISTANVPSFSRTTR